MDREWWNIMSRGTTKAHMEMEHMASVYSFFLFFFFALNHCWDWGWCWCRLLAATERRASPFFLLQLFVFLLSWLSYFPPHLCPRVFFSYPALQRQLRYRANTEHLFVLLWHEPRCSSSSCRLTPLIRGEGRVGSGKKEHGQGSRRSLLRQPLPE